MPGPAPKNPATRQRRNKKPTTAVLTGGHELLRDLDVTRPDGEAWHPVTLAMWADLQASPMHSEYVRSDYYLALGWALAFDAAMWKPNVPNLTTLTRFVEHFGLSPRSRRTLQWEVKRVEAIEKPAATKPAAPVKDPRLRLVG